MGVKIYISGISGNKEVRDTLRRHKFLVKFSFILTGEKEAAKGFNDFG